MQELLVSLDDETQRRYLNYALSVITARALPDVRDGLKPVQRRILYAMDQMGLGYSGPSRNVAAKPVKSARVVGDVRAGDARWLDTHPECRAHYEAWAGALR